MSDNVTAQQIKRMVAALEASGRPVLAARLYPDGSIALLTEPGSEALPASIESSWVEMAGEREAHVA